MEELAIEIVKSYPDGFNFAQLQTGLNKFQLNELLQKNGFEFCFECNNFTIKPHSTDQFCDECTIFDDGYY